MWDYATNGSLWVHINSIIHVPPEININSVTNIPTSKGEVPITMFPYINGSTCLVSMNDCVVQTESTYRELFRPYSYSRRPDMFHTRTVGV